MPSTHEMALHMEFSARKLLALVGNNDLGSCLTADRFETHPYAATLTALTECLKHTNCDRAAILSGFITAYAAGTARLALLAPGEMAVDDRLELEAAFGNTVEDIITALGNAKV